MKRNPIPTIDDICEVCGKPYAELHEVFFGTGQRQMSIEHKMQVRLCGEHHRGKTGPHMNKTTDDALKRSYQCLFESRQMEEGFDADEARERFRKIFGRSCL